MDDEITRAARARKGTPFLSTQQAAFYLGLSARKLQELRGQGAGPRFRRHGRFVRYHIDDLDDWSLEGALPASTSCRSAAFLANPLGQVLEPLVLSSPWFTAATPTRQDGLSRWHSSDHRGFAGKAFHPWTR